MPEPLAPRPRTGVAPKRENIASMEADRIFRATLRPDDSKWRRRRASSAPRRNPWASEVSGEGILDGGRRKKEEDDEDLNKRKLSSHLYANELFYQGLRSWPSGQDVKDKTKKGWSVADVDSRRSRRSGTSKDELEEVKKKSSVWQEDHFRGGLRNYPKDDEYGRSFDNEYSRDKDVAFGKDKKKGLQAAGGEQGSIYRKVKQSDKLTQDECDEYFLGSLRSEQRMSTDEYQRQRRANLKLPAFRDLSAEQVAKAKRIFAQVDLDGSGSIDGEEMRKFLVAMGYKESDKVAKKLIADADEGTKDSKLQLQEFCRLYHGMQL